MITKVTIEWGNGDRRTFQNGDGGADLNPDQLRAARAVIGEDLPKSDKAAAAAKPRPPATAG